MSFATKVNNQFKDMDRRIGEVGAKTEAVTKKVEEHTAEIGEVRGDMRKLEEKLEEMEKKLEDRMCEEMREREIRRLNLVLHRVEEPSQRIRDGRERMEADKKACVKIFKAMKVPSSSEDIRFCRRIGEKGDEPRPLLIGVKTEEVKRNLLEKAKDLMKTEFKEVAIGPDMTMKQRQEEKKMREEVDRRNKEDLTEEDRAKNLEWLLVGARGEKRIIKGVSRDPQEGTSKGKGKQVSGKRKTRARDSDTEEEDGTDMQETQRPRKK
jgi:uncharacterized membrane protein